MTSRRARARVAVLGVLGTLGAFGAVRAEPPAPAADAQAGAPAGAPVMRIYRDPATGEIGAPPPGTPLEGATESVGTSAEGLVETPGTSPAGGVTVDLKGRFRSAVSATKDPTVEQRPGN